MCDLVRYIESKINKRGIYYNAEQDDNFRYRGGTRVRKNVNFQNSAILSHKFWKSLHWKSLWILLYTAVKNLKNLKKLTISRHQLPTSTPTWIPLSPTLFSLPHNFSHTKPFKSLPLAIIIHFILFTLNISLFRWVSINSLASAISFSIYKLLSALFFKYHTV